MIIFMFKYTSKVKVQLLSCEVYNCFHVSDAYFPINMLQHFFFFFFFSWKGIFSSKEDLSFWKINLIKTKGSILLSFPPYFPPIFYFINDVRNFSYFCPRCITKHQFWILQWTSLSEQASFKNVLQMMLQILKVP